MAVFRIAALGVCLVAGFCALPVWASSGSDGASCVAVSDDAARLACYDRAYGRDAAGKSAATAVQAAPAVATPKDPVAEFGLTEAAKQAKDPAKAAEAAKSPTSVTAKVINVRFKRYGEFVVTLDNGQVWEQNEPMPSAIVRIGDTVTVKKAALGSYALVTAARVATKVHRVD